MSGIRPERISNENPILPTLNISWSGIIFLIKVWHGAAQPFCK
jgi:hypothetical protein